MPLALVLLTAGVWVAYAGLKGLSLVDVLSGKGAGGSLDPSGGKLTPVGRSSDGGNPNTTPLTDDIGAIGKGSPKDIIDNQVLPLAKKNGMVTGIDPGRVAAANAAHGPTITGGHSDHQGPPNVAWAVDMSNGTSPTPEMDQLARDIANRFSIPWNGSGAVSKTIGGMRYQLIYRSYVGGNHYNHVHLGVKKV